MNHSQMLNTMNQLQMTFTPGQWDRVTMTAVYDAEGYTYTKAYTQNDIPADQLPALAAVVTALVGLHAPWQARQVIATLGDDTVINNPAAEEGMVDIHEAVLLSVEVVNEQGGRKIIPPHENMEFVLTSPEAIEFFNYFTAHHINNQS